METNTSVHPKTSSLRTYRVEIVIVTVGVFFINAIFLAKAFRETWVIDRTAAGQLGDFVGGYVGSIFALISVVLLYATLRNQIALSQHQNFENKYFELIRMHRDNVAELQVQETVGRKIFVLMIRELREILSIAQKLALRHDQTLSQRQLMHLAFYCLLFGTGPNSSRMLIQNLSGFDRELVTSLESELNNRTLKEQVRDDRQLGYKPFEGHQSRLGHYYRHLFQMVQYVDAQIISIDKYEYVETIRAQLSTHEQALLLVASLTPFGHEWWSSHLITKYHFVKDIPLEFFDSRTELDVSQLFPSDYFDAT
jgi:hypothetical protein